MDFKLVKGKCQVMYSENLKSLEEYFEGGMDRFYFTEVKIVIRWFWGLFLYVKLTFEVQSEVMILNILGLS